MPFSEFNATMYEDDYVQISYDAELRAMALTYKRSGTSAEFRAMHYKFMKAIEQKRVSKILVDTLKMGVIAPEDQRWLGQTMILLLAQATPNNYLYSAVIMPGNIFTQLAVHNIEQLTIGTGTCLNKHFDNMTDAREWLRNQG